MNTLSNKFFSTAVLVLGALVSTAAAHPGAPGHTHDDEWPFDMMPALGVGALVIVACIAMGRSSKKS